jgi:hypothetical protein
VLPLLLLLLLLVSCLLHVPVKHQLLLLRPLLPLTCLRYLAAAAC